MSRTGPARPKTPAGVIVAKLVVHLLALTPMAILAWQIRAEWLTGSGGLGADPVAEIEHRLGLWALRMLLLTLAITPLRQVTGQAVLLRFRRLLGLYAFAYASLHFSAYLVLDLRGYWTQVFEEIVKRPYITVGFAAWLLLVPLALTSTKAAMRRLGRNWGRLHLLVYATAVLAVLHFWWLVKSDIREPAMYAAILAVLLGWRLWKKLASRRTLSARRTSATG
ncbi:protein-methionine-sulfoxide reductase heme-binding subunit MsrQ [Lysobacter psychrotolerans]|uniref:Protein-methionine-sulfoxide reductase heme-binding subunit MsrQ n=2 Tax=Montanilutibacter psychrotolerans TaxID=1327343 RepID=A0A3M8SPZ5_9GAMM|nr:protein-methionine-sulfoxide reductase heme-binding subunit MsrQ [Lysobacter psychrotolerans]